MAKNEQLIPRLARDASGERVSFLLVAILLIAGAARFFAKIFRPHARGW